MSTYVLTHVCILNEQQIRLCSQPQSNSVQKQGVQWKGWWSVWTGSEECGRQHRQNGAILEWGSMRQDFEDGCVEQWELTHVSLGHSKLLPQPYLALCTQDFSFTDLFAQESTFSVQVSPFPFQVAIPSPRKRSWKCWTLVGLFSGQCNFIGCF